MNNIKNLTSKIGKNETKTMPTPDLKAIVVDQLKVLVAAGKIACMRCKYPASGSDITEIDLVNKRVFYKCPNEVCHNHGHIGYRTFRALGITLPAVDIPSDLAMIVAPPPPEPESVEWTDDSADGEADGDDGSDDEV